MDTPTSFSANKKASADRKKLSAIIALGVCIPPAAALVLATVDSPTARIAGVIVISLVTLALVLTGARRALAETQKVIEDIHRCAASIKSADTQALELTVKMMTEIGDGAKQAESANDVMEALEETLRGVAGTSEQLSSNVAMVATAGEEISTNIASTAGTAEEISSNMSAVATTVEEMSSNLNTVDQAVRELSTVIDGISENARMGASVASEAANTTTSTRGVMRELGESATRIGKVTSVIQVIAQQTNLLALNAAIEAASAGDAGRGFAVVANEVKELAKQTHAATEDIEETIQEIQAKTANAVEAIDQIASVVDKINELQGTIATTVARQSKASGEISRNVSEAAQGVNAISRNINESALGATQVSKGVGEIASGANETARNIAEAAVGISELSKNNIEMSEIGTEAVHYIVHTRETTERFMKDIHVMSELVDKISESIQKIDRLSTRV